MLKTTFVILLNGHIPHYNKDTGLVHRYDHYPSEEEIIEVLAGFPYGLYVTVEKQTFLSED